MDLCKALFIKHMSKEANEAPSSPPTAYDAGIQGLAKTQVRLVVVSIVWNVVVVLQVSRGVARRSYFRNAGDYWDWRSKIAVGWYTTGLRSQRLLLGGL